MAEATEHGGACANGALHADMPPWTAMLETRAGTRSGMEANTPPQVLTMGEEEHVTKDGIRGGSAHDTVGGQGGRAAATAAAVAAIAGDRMQPCRDLIGDGAGTRDNRESSGADAGRGGGKDAGSGDIPKAGRKSIATGARTGGWG